VRVPKGPFFSLGFSSAVGGPSQWVGKLPPPWLSGHLPPFFLPSLPKPPPPLVRNVLQILFLFCFCSHPPPPLRNWRVLFFLETPTLKAVFGISLLDWAFFFLSSRARGFSPPLYTPFSSAPFRTSKFGPPPPLFQQGFPPR